MQTRYQVLKKALHIGTIFNKSDPGLFYVFNKDMIVGSSDGKRQQ